MNAFGSLQDSSLTLLLVEDDESHAQLVEQAIRRCGYAATLVRVQDGTAAIAYLRGNEPYEGQRRPDVILLDLNLPGVDGLQVLQEIKTDEQLRAIPTVIITSSDADTDRMQAYLYYVNSYVLKPVDPVQFRKLFQDLMRYWSQWNRPSPAHQA